MKKIFSHRLVTSVSLLFIALLIVVAPAWSASKARAGDTSHRFSNNPEMAKKAIEKLGYFHGIEKGRVILTDQKTYRKSMYIAAQDMIFTDQGQEIDVLEIWPSSLVKLILINFEVVEIILLQESS